MSSSPETVETVQTVESARPTQTLVRTRSGREGGLIYKPLIRPSGASRYEIRGQREDKSIIAWGFWGGLLVLVVLGLLIASAQTVYNVWDIIWFLAALAVGSLLYRYGRRSSLREEVLCEVDLERRTLAWPGAEQGDGEIVLYFDEINEVVFGMTDYPVSKSRQDVQVHAFTLLVRDAEDRLVPVVEASPDKEEAHTIAKILGNELNLRISYVGKGIR
jgi:hypothetical protein